MSEDILDGQRPEAMLRLLGIEVLDDDNASSHLLPDLPVH